MFASELNARGIHGRLDDGTGDDASIMEFSWSDMVICPPAGQWLGGFADKPA
jgi:hypothetical protein